MALCLPSLPRPIPHNTYPLLSPYKEKAQRTSELCFSGEDFALALRYWEAEMLFTISELLPNTSVGWGLASAVLGQALQPHLSSGLHMLSSLVPLSPWPLVPLASPRVFCVPSQHWACCLPAGCLQ